MTAEVSGKIHIYEESKIAYIQFIDDDGLLKKLIAAKTKLFSIHAERFYVVKGEMAKIFNNANTIKYI